jgi:hypothetical protein
MVRILVVSSSDTSTMYVLEDEGPKGRGGMSGAGAWKAK